MGFRKPDFDGVQNAIGKVLVEIKSPYNDGFTSSHCKRDLYLLKCWLDDEYNKLPSFAGEEKWEQERLIGLLKRQ
jgi:hypothetical protein